jgi:hypothetical protein
MNSSVEQLYKAPEIPDKWSIIPIHASDRASFKRCKRYWNWNSPSRQNLAIRADIYGVNIPLWFGTGIHYALEQFYTPGLSHDPVEAWKTWFDIQWRGGIVTEEWLDRIYDLNPQPIMATTAEERHQYPFGITGYRVRGLQDIVPDPNVTEYIEHYELGIGMMEFYKIYAEKNDDFTVVAAEHTFSVPIWDHDNDCIMKRVDTREDSPNYGKELEVHARGRMDQIWQNNYSGKFGIRDYKTTSRIDEDYFRKLESDEQVCVPLDKSQALTKQGWKYRNDLSIGDEILAYDRDREILDWTPILNITDAVADVHKLTSNVLSVEATANHRWVGKKRVFARFNGKMEIIGWKPWEGRSDSFPQSHIKIVVAADSVVDGNLPITPNEAAFLGWLLGDGHFAIYNRSLEVSITQSKKKFVNDIADLVDNLNFVCSAKEYDNECITWRFSAPQMRELLNRAKIISKSDDLTEFVLGLSKKARIAFCDAAYKAEGSMTRSQRMFAQNIGPLRDAFRLAFVLNGEYTTYGAGKGFSLKSDREIDARSIKFNKITHKPDSKVWCPTTKYGTWLMRQGEQICITGNTNYLWAAEIEAKYYDLPHKGQPIELCIYEALRKAYPKPPTILKSGMFSVDKTKESTTYEMLMDYLSSSGLSVVALDAKQQGYVDWLKEVGDEQFIIRRNARRSRGQLANFGKRLFYEALDMLEPDPIYPNISNDFNCLNCQFRLPCMTQEDGGDYLELIAQNYTSNKDR